MFVHENFGGELACMICSLLSGLLETKVLD